MKTKNRLAIAVLARLEIEQFKKQIEERRKLIKQTVFPFENENYIEDHELVEDAISILKDNKVEFRKTKHGMIYIEYEDVYITIYENDLVDGFAKKAVSDIYKV